MLQYVMAFGLAFLAAAAVGLRFMGSVRSLLISKGLIQGDQLHTFFEHEAAKSAQRRIGTTLALGWGLAAYVWIMGSTWLVVAIAICAAIPAAYFWTEGLQEVQAAFELDQAREPSHGGGPSSPAS